MPFFGKKARVAKLRKQYEAKLKEAMEAQRGGDIQRTSELHEEAEALLRTLQEAER